MKIFSTTIKLLIPLYFFSLFGCHKKDDIKPSASGIEIQKFSFKEDVSVMLQISSDIIEKGTELGFYAFINGTENSVDCGKITLQKFNVNLSIWENIAGAENIPITGGYADFTIAKAKEADSGNYRWLYNGGDRCAFNDAVSGNLEVAIIKKKELPYEEIY